MADQRLAQIASHLNFPRGLLHGQTAIITGSGQGIGAECAIAFANEGCKVIITDIDSSKAEGVARSINDRLGSGSALAVPGDVTDEKHIKLLVEKASEFGGDGKIHHIVNMAGYTWDAILHKMTDKQWSAILDIHATAPFRLVREASPFFRVTDGENRSVIQISSTSGIHGNAGQANYAFAKAGVTGLTKTIAKEWGPKYGVRANTIAFGKILTRLTAPKEEGSFMQGPGGEKIALGIPKSQLEAVEKDGHVDIPLRRAGTAKEAALVVLAVASPLFGYVSGETIKVTGGRGM